MRSLNHASLVCTVIFLWLVLIVDYAVERHTKDASFSERFFRAFALEVVA